MRIDLFAVIEYGHNHWQTESFDLMTDALLATMAGPMLEKILLRFETLFTI